MGLTVVESGRFGSEICRGNRLLLLFHFFYFIFRFVVAGDAMLDAAMESSSGSYEYDQHLNINKTMVNTLSFALLPC